MDEFKTLNGYYAYVEADTSLLYDINISKRLLALRESLVDETSKSHCTYEILFNQFPVHKGKFHPEITYVSGETFPNLTLFADGLDYLKLRAKNVTNAKYKAKYNHLLWECVKHNNFGTSAIDNYYTLLSRMYQDNGAITDDGLTQQAFQNHYETLYAISQWLNYRIDEVTALFEMFLKSDKINGFKKVSIMTFIVKEGKKNSPSVLQNFLDYCRHVVDRNEHSLLVENYLELSILLSQKLRANAAPLYEALAEHYLRQGKDRNDSFVSHDFYIKAISNFQKAGNRAKVEEVSVLLEKAKRTLSFKTIKSEYSGGLLDVVWKLTIEHLDTLLEEHGSNAIYEYLICYDGLIPKATVLDNNTKPEGLLQFMRVMSFDINKNVNTKGSFDVNAYFTHIRNFTIHKVWYLFSKGIKSGKVSYESLMQYLRDRSWYSQDFTYVDADGDQQGFDWIKLIGPSLYSFFQQSQIGLTLKKDNGEGYILAVDSLTLKFEGLLREFCRSIGAQTVEFKADGTEERISFDKLLGGEKIQALMPANDIAFLRFLFTDAGMNLRNDIAHCFYTNRKYSAGVVLLLIVALLRLGNYRLEPQSGN